MMVYDQTRQRFRFSGQNKNILLRGWTRDYLQEDGVELRWSQSLRNNAWWDDDRQQVLIETRKVQITYKEKLPPQGQRSNGTGCLVVISIFCFQDHEKAQRTWCSNMSFELEVRLDAFWCPFPPKFLWFLR